MGQDQAVDARVSETLCRIDVDTAARCDADFEIIQGPTRLLAGLAQSGNALGGALGVERKAEPSFGQARRPAVSAFGVAAEDNFGIRLLHRARHRIDATEGYET